jgi:electron transfer flavoprotein alpha subunit
MSVLVILEAGHRMAPEAAAAARQFSQALGVPLIAATIPAYQPYTADGFTAAYEAHIKNVNPKLVVFAHTYQTRDYAPKLATRFGKVLIGDVIAARVSSDSLVFVRQLFQGKFNADVRATGDAPHFVSVQAGAFPPAAWGGAADVETVSLTPGDARQRPEARYRESARAVDLSAAPLIVSVGRGIKEQENIAIVEKLAQALGAELAASRPICDAGWLPMERQVGSSGQTVAPKLYLAIGISGAIQHLVGMKGSKTIAAINQDPNAPIFEVADYGIVGDLFEVVPALTEAIKAAKS